MPVTPVLMKLRQRGCHELEAGLNYSVRSCLKVNRRIEQSKGEMNY